MKNTEEEKEIKRIKEIKLDSKNIFLILGVILLLFGTVLAFTTKSFWTKFDLTKTGNIGDTIGGITAPVINLIGAILVYISFKAQTNSNNIQYKLLHSEIDNQKYDRNFQVGIELFRDIKLDVDKMEYKTHRGHQALTYFTNINSKATKKEFLSDMNNLIFDDWQFIILQYTLAIDYIINSNLRITEREKLTGLLRNYYYVKLGYTSRKLIPCFDKFKICDRLKNKLTELEVKLGLKGEIL